MDSILYHSSDYYLYADDGEELDYDYNAAKEDLQYLCDEYSTSMILTGSMGLWSGNHDVSPQIVANLEDVIDRLSDTETLKILEGDDGYLEIYNYHHDGCNIYSVKPLHELTKRELQEVVRKTVRDLKDALEDYYGHRSITKLTKDELIEFLEWECM